MTDLAILKELPTCDTSKRINALMAENNALKRENAQLREQVRTLTEALRQTEHTLREKRVLARNNQMRWVGACKAKRAMEINCKGYNVLKFITVAAIGAAIMCGILVMSTIFFYCGMV